jgi:hypothetical protein
VPDYFTTLYGGSGLKEPCALMKPGALRERKPSACEEEKSPIAGQENRQSPTLADIRPTKGPHLVISLNS